jgi:hypothetical protein
VRSQEEAATDAKKNLAFTIMALQDADVSEELLDQAEELYDEVRELDNRYNVEKAFEKVNERRESRDYQSINPEKYTK